MNGISLPKAQRLANILVGCTKAAGLYPAGHPAHLGGLRELLALLADASVVQPRIRIGIQDDMLIVDQHLLIPSGGQPLELVELLRRRGIGSVLFHLGVDMAELGRFVELLARKPAADTGGNDWSAAFLPHIGLFPEVEAAGEEGGEDAESPRGTYFRALGVVRNLFADIDRGRIPHGEMINAVMDGMVDMTIKDPRTLIGLTLIKDYDNYTFNHSVNVGILALALGASLELPREALRELGVAGLLHDIGKTRVSKEILNKPGKLTSAEYEKMKCHAEDGVRIIKEIRGIGPRVGQAVLGHHIRFNRQGYPEWARKLPFDRMCDIIAVADSYDAITTMRAYSSPINPKAALDELRKLSGSFLDGELVGRFIQIMGKYPVGTLVRLDSNQIALVVRPNPNNEEAPLLKVIVGANGEKLEIPRLLDLEKEGGAAIVVTVDPLARNIDVAAYLD